VARFLGLIVPARAGPVDRIELELPGGGNHEIVAYVVHPESAVAKGQRIPRWARPSLVIRDGRTLRPHRFGRPQAGDRIYVITTPEYVALLDRLFAGRAPGADALLRRELSGEIEPGDRISVGAVDIIVRRVNDAHDIEEVGLAMEQMHPPLPQIPLFQSPREIAALVKGWLRLRK